MTYFNALAWHSPEELKKKKHKKPWVKLDYAMKISSCYYYIHLLCGQPVKTAYA